MPEEKLTFWERYKWDFYLFLIISAVLLVSMIIIKSQLTDQAAYYVYGYPPMRDPQNPESALANANTPCVVLPTGVDTTNMQPYHANPTPMCYRDSTITNNKSFKTRLAAWLSNKPRDGSNRGKPYESAQQCNIENGIIKTN